MTDLIRQLENKILRRNFSLSPASALTKEEREVYADFLETKGHVKGAEVFRNYVEEDKPKGKGTQVRKRHRR